jgi:anti-sigma B factor antagonist
MSEFDVTVVNRNGRAIVFMRGEIDLSAKEQIHDALATARQGSADVIVDLSQVTFMDSTGINALVRAHREAPAGRFHVVGATRRIRRVFDVTGLAPVLLNGSLRLTWQQVTHHVSGWRQWMTYESTQDGAPMGEIIEVGPFPKDGGDGAQYLLEMGGRAALYGSLAEAMSAACDPQAAVTAARAEE